MRDKNVAVVTINKAGEMHKQGRQWVANWLRRTATLLERKGDKFAKTFRARYIAGKQDQVEGN